MSTVTVSGTVAAGYKLKSPVGYLTVSTTGYIEGAGVYTLSTASAAYTVDNYGKVKGLNSGVYLADGGTVLNGSEAGPAALVQGDYGVEIRKAFADVTNYGSILANGAGVYLAAGGDVENGTALDPTALIKSNDNLGVRILQASGMVSNYGTILARSHLVTGGGAYLGDGGQVTNGNHADTTALIEGGTALFSGGAAGTVISYGTIVGLYGYGISLNDGGKVTNGTHDDTQALITGARRGLQILTGVGTVINFGTVDTSASHFLSNSDGVDLGAGGTVTNGAAGDRNALIEGYNDGVAISGAVGTVTSFGTIESRNAAAVSLYDGGVITNGAAGDQVALVVGYEGVLVSGGLGAVTNFGSIVATGGAGDYGLEMTHGGHVTDGAAGDHNALIEGYGGVRCASVAGTVVNFGTVLGTGGGAGVDLSAGGAVTNGSVTDKTALIQGYTGLQMLAGGTVTNFGTVVGIGGASNAVTLIGGSLTNGTVNDTIARIDGYTGVYLADGATFTNFGTIVGEGGVAVYDQYSVLSTVIAEAGSVFVGGAQMNGGSLQLVGGVVTMGGLETSGAVSGAGTLALDAGTSVFEGGASLAISQIAVTGVSTGVDAEIASLTYAGAWLQSAGTLDVFTGDKVTLTGAGDTFSGTVTGSGSVVWSGGSDSFSNLTLSATSQTVTGAAITFSGAINLTTNMTLTSSNLVVAAGGATIGGAGEFILSSNATNSFYGAGSSATLTVNGKVYGAGQLGVGQMTLIIGAGGFVDGYTTTPLTINTGANAITNAGTIFAIGAGGTVVDSAVTNTGKLYADGGTLTLNGAVTGTGVGDITSGTLFAASSFTENVIFTASTTGTLELADSQTYTGDITGFSLTGATTLDLGDIDFINGTTKATYSGTATSGTLTVTDGTHTAHITLEGNYTSSTFTVSSDGHGGTKVVDPTKAPAGGQLPASPQSLIAAMAAASANDHGSIALTAEPWRAPAATLAGPRAAMA